mmetsp:Transcript_37875/g.77270  ORF Transcript_37875/g.77270 Transcript_37875/m.77270 type:complete len:341 (-) Transcript_37875:121-1143(-)
MTDGGATAAERVALDPAAAAVTDAPPSASEAISGSEFDESSDKTKTDAVVEADGGEANSESEGADATKEGAMRHQTPIASDPTPPSADPPAPSGEGGAASGDHPPPVVLPRDEEVGSLVGTPSVVGAAHRVTEPRSAVNDPIPVPSVYSDPRGSIHNLSSGGRRINVIHTRRGVMRSGDVHPNTQCDFLFSGRARVWMLGSDGATSTRIYGAKDLVLIPPYVPHVFEFLEDTVMAEWWEDGGGRPSEFRAWFYDPYRERVDASFPEDDDRDESSGKAKGRLVALVEKKNDEEGEEGVQKADKNRTEEEKMREVILGCYTVLSIGAVAFVTGFIFGFRRSR